MADDISKYIDFGPPEPKKCSVKSIVNKRVTIRSWQMRNGRFGVYAEMSITTDEGDFTCNVGRQRTLEQLKLVEQKKSEIGESDMSFDCIPRRNGNDIIFMPCDR